MNQHLTMPTQIIHIPQPGSAIDTDWLKYFDPQAALESVVGHIVALPSHDTPEKHTARAYESSLRYFLAWLTDSPVDTDIHQLVRMPMPLPTQAVMVHFRGHLRATGRAASTIGRYFAPIRHWLNALRKQHIPGLTGDVRDQVEDYRHAINDALDIKPPKPTESSTRSALYRYGTRLRVDQINDLLASISASGGLDALRDLALTYLGITSALRISEMSRVTLSSITPGETSPYEITVRGKRGQTDPVAVDTTAVNLIHAWVNAFNAALPDPDTNGEPDPDTNGEPDPDTNGEPDPRYIDEHTPIWQPLRRGCPESLHSQYTPKNGLSRVALRDIIMRRANTALGIDLNPHDLRRTYTARANDLNIPLNNISRQLRHKNLATTARYIGDPENMGAALLSNRIQFCF